MKTTHFFLAGPLLLVLFACRSEIQPSGRNIDFGIYETADAGELPIPVWQQLHAIQVETLQDTQNAIAGYTARHDRAWQDSLTNILTDEGITFALTAFSFPERNNAFAVVALKQPAMIGLEDIREAMGQADRVEIRFNMQGARKWAEMTELNTGRQVAFVVEGQIYSLPQVTAPIRSGMALITGLDAEEAGRIARLLNGVSGS